MINIGNNEISGLYVGNTPVQSVYVGDTQVWSNAQWHTIYDGDGSWFIGTHNTSPSNVNYLYGSTNIDRNNTLSGLDFKPNTKYRIWITGLNRQVKVASKDINRIYADVIDPMYIECDDNLEIRLNSTFAGSPDHNRIYTLFHVVDGKLVCTVYYAANKENRYNYTYYVAILVTKIEQYY